MFISNKSKSGADYFQYRLPGGHMLELTVTLAIDAAGILTFVLESAIWNIQLPNLHRIPKWQFYK